MNSTAQPSPSTRLVPPAVAARDSDSSSSVRPRARRLGNSASLLSASPSPSPTRGASPIPSERIGSVTGRNDRSASRPAAAGTGRSATSTPGGGGLLDTSWASGWASVQGFAASLLAGGDDTGDGGLEGSRGRNGSSSRLSTRQISDGDASSSKRTGAWGPEPPKKWSSRMEDVAAGSRAEREAALRAMRTASVLESHDGVNNGLDTSTARFKKRRSDEDIRSSGQSDVPEEHLVYIHHVRRDDTYAGIVLKYRCREDAFRKANGLWSRDNIQVRKWLAMPVDACEVRGRPCEGPSLSGDRVDLLAPTPDPVDSLTSHGQGGQGQLDDFFAAAASSSKSADQPKPEEEAPPPWTHVRWVTIDNFPEPVEIARVPRNSMGYFPPRRKKTLRSVSAFSSPRGSLDALGTAPGSEAIGSPESTSSRRHSMLSGGQPAALAYGSSTSTSSRSRVNSGGDDHKPAWMRRPGGVGSMGKNVHAPGPAKDYLNSWAKKHAPSLNIDSFPSMSVMGAEIARLAISGNDQPSIVESPFEEGRDVSANSRQGLGLDKAAAAVETWLRGAFAKRPGTPSLAARGQQSTPLPGDLIELTDTNSDDGRGGTSTGGPEFPDLSVQNSPSYGPVRGVRGRSPGGAKANKAD